MKIRRHHQHRSGDALVLTAFTMVLMFGMIAFAVDIGYLHVVRTELQSSADAAALAATSELIDAAVLAGNADPSQTIATARATAGQYAYLNQVANQGPALATEDVTIGYLDDPFDPAAQMSFADPSRFNAVQVRVRRTVQQNGDVSLFFASVLGIGSSDQQAQATAAFLNNFGGFGVPSSGANLDILPFALDKGTWDSLLAGTGADDWSWDATGGTVTSGQDGILEVNLYPQSTGAPGNRGTVDIGSSNNSTADIARQILYGISPQDLAYLNGTLELDQNGELKLNGDTGISAGVKDELEQIKGEPRIIPIFSQVSGSGNNAQYTIVEFAGIRIMEVKLTGSMSGKRVMIQPADVTVSGGIPATGGNPKSHFVHSPVWLIR